jgi:hypothetical protein
METPNLLSVTVTMNFWRQYFASPLLIRYQVALVIIHSLFPLMGLFILVDSLYEGFRFGTEEVVLILVSFLFTPLVTALAVCASRTGNQLMRGSFTYSFDSQGLQTKGGLHRPNHQVAGYT